MSDFKESEHPRDTDGKFTVKGKQFKRKALLNLLRQKRAKTASKVSGGISGALDSLSPEAEEHANKEYEAIRKNKYDVIKISQHTGFSLQQIKAIKDYVFFQPPLWRYQTDLK